MEEEGGSGRGLAMSRGEPAGFLESGSQMLDRGRGNFFI